MTLYILYYPLIMICYYNDHGHSEEVGRLQYYFVTLVLLCDFSITL